MAQKLFIPRPDMKLGDRYQLVECLGEGSYGWVWRAERLADAHTVALKIPKAQASKRSDLEEGKPLLGTPTHPNVIEIYWMGRVPPEHEWFVIEMEYFPSSTLAELLEQDDPAFTTSYQRLFELYERVLMGVRHLHDLGLCHGDIKPQNILVAQDGLKLTDFGSSFLPDDLYAKTRENGGTILYSAPEVVGTSLRGRGSDTKYAADIYSLGVLLYHLLTSRLPHETLSQVARHTPFPRPTEINSTISPAVEEYILRCLHASPADRWPSVDAMQAGLGSVRRSQLDYQPIRLTTVKVVGGEDWAATAVRLMSDGKHQQAEAIAQKLYESSGDPHAFLCMVSAASKDERYFDCLKALHSHPEMFAKSSPVQRDLRYVELKCYLETRQIDRAEIVVDECIAADGDTPSLLLQRASILGLQARYEEARDVLLRLNREYPQTPAILKRLVIVFEQLRDPGKASAFLKAYARRAPDDQWARRKLDQLATIGT